ncbi:ATP-binding cassette domain-containing protein [Vibrio sp. SCSIO 43137]|uniref:ATP-binding cassette domain-containing protein n=1 Tax=Vibrio sp. SCSIO 43137 TaxID=3021011 RepID=UPI00230748B7|nr:ATP-binding cassette domain-containing protein [Vibrio sp. SCSIO 43137]WCE28522.1 ATP-binding cassette domain-containing protein [Vibrio sp. SCSIO 43137]
MTLSLKNLVIYNSDKEKLFDPVSIDVQPGHILSLMGPSGCGKSTLLSAIAGHLSEDFHYHGEITLDSVSLDSLPAHKRQVGILFQDDLLFPHLSVVENLAFALPDAIKGEERDKQALQALSKIKLASLANSMPDQISGGQRARVSLVRMLLARPKLVLLDEPFSKLDKNLREEFREWVFGQIADANVPALLVTHDSADVPSSGRCLTWPWMEQVC